MVSHFLLLALFALLVSTVFAVIQRDDVREQMRLALLMTAGFVGVAVALGWVLYPFPL